MQKYPHEHDKKINFCRRNVPKRGALALLYCNNKDTHFNILNLSIKYDNIMDIISHKKVLSVTIYSMYFDYY